MIAESSICDFFVVESGNCILSSIMALVSPQSFKNASFLQFQVACFDAGTNGKQMRQSCNQFCMSKWLPMRHILKEGYFHQEIPEIQHHDFALTDCFITIHVHQFHSQSVAVLRSLTKHFIDILSLTTFVCEL